MLCPQRSAHRSHYRRATTTLRAFANVVLDELAARGIPIPPAPEKPKVSDPPEPDGGVSPLLARAIERHRRVLPSEETVCEMFGIARPN
jgi:hypothetical protein